MIRNNMKVNTSKMKCICVFLFVYVCVSLPLMQVLSIHIKTPRAVLIDGLSLRFSTNRNIFHYAQRYTLSKPHLVLGILSSADNPTRRHAVRNTWITTLNKLRGKLPFRITYKFLMDEPTDSSISENNIHKDMVYLNVTHHGYANKFGEKLHNWLKYIWNNFPDVSLGVKMDDDVFLCVPHILYRLSELRSPTLYYGWKHGYHKDKNITTTTHIDEMFVVLGSDLIKRFANRNYCGKPTCDNKDDLQEIDYADTSLVLWMAKYQDIDLHADNTRILQFGATQLTRLKPFVTSYFCEDFVLFHKALPDVMTKLHRLNQYQENALDLVTPGNTTNDLVHGSAVTGSLFTGNVVRYMIPSITSKPLEPVGKITSLHSNITCDNWAVVTTIQRPTKAIKNFLKETGWCIIVIADVKTPTKSDYLDSLPGGQNRNRLVFLSLQKQSEMFPLLSESIPNNSIGRKNIGFMYAIYRRAKAIWDFDDDNSGVIDLKEFGPETVANSYVKVCDKGRNKLVNPYPYFGVPESFTWPRGFPLQSIKDQSTIPNVCKTDTKPIKVGVIQSLANGQPDVDAIYRLTRKVPFNFSSKKNKRGFIIPKDCFSPFNAQATLWLSPAFKFIPLPISVNGRVSDIWRSYIAQYFMHKEDIKLTFVKPYVVQERNAHTLIRDFNAEKDLYEKSKQIIDFLSRPYNRNYETMEDVYENLYKRKYIELSDLRFIKAWETTLSHVENK